MKLSPQEVNRIAHLSRIELTPSEAGHFRTELSEIIDYNAKKLAQVKRRVTVIQAPSASLGQTDQARPSLPSEDALSNAPQVDNGLFVVPKVLD